MDEQKKRLELTEDVDAEYPEEDDAPTGDADGEE